MNNENKILRVYDIIDPGEEKFIPAIYEKDKPSFDMAVKLLKLFIPLEWKILQDNIHYEVQKALLGLYIQSFRLFRSIVILCKSGLDSEAFILLRSLLEVISYLLYIGEKDHGERLEYYQHSRNLSEEIAMRLFLDCFPDEELALNGKKQQICRKKEEAIQYFKKKHGQNIELKDIKKKCLRAKQAGESLKNNKFFIKMYKIIHPRAAAISHGEKIDEFIDSTDNPTEFRIRLGSTSRSIPTILSFSMTLFFLGIQKINELLQTGKDNVITDMDNELYEFVKNYNKSIIKS